MKAFQEHQETAIQRLVENAVFPLAQSVKESICNAGDQGSIPESRRFPEEGNGNPLQYSCLENPMDRGAWWAIVHGIARVRHDLVSKPPLPEDEVRKIIKVHLSGALGVLL